MNDQPPTTPPVRSGDLLARTTPGPWFKHMQGGGKGGPNAYVISTTKEFGGEGVTHITVARCPGKPGVSAGWDAKLIAKAPELYQACKAANYLLMSLLASPGASPELIQSIQLKLQNALDAEC